MAKITDVESGWWDEFKGRCVACRNAVPSSRKNEMTCQSENARDKGLPSRPGGSWNGDPVHKLFGCVFFQCAYLRGEKQVEPKES